MYLKTDQTNKKKGTVKSERKRLIKRLDDLVREIVCKDHTCCCCNKWSEVIQPGHYITRKVYAIRWNLLNVHSQCQGCNLRHNYDPSPYTRYLLNTYGKQVIDELIDQKNNAPKTTLTRMREIEQELLKLCVQN